VPFKLPQYDAQQAFMKKFQKKEGSAWYLDKYSILHIRQFPIHSYNSLDYCHKLLDRDLLLQIHNCNKCIILQMQTVRKLEGINGNLHTFTDPENCKRSQMAGCSVV
jgi:hypothetical protein